MAGFEPGFSGIGSDRSATCATTAARRTILYSVHRGEIMKIDLMLQVMRLVLTNQSALVLHRIVVLW